jgi:glucose/arabinose dehydrogenase
VRRSLARAGAFALALVIAGCTSEPTAVPSAPASVTTSRSPSPSRRPPTGVPSERELTKVRVRLNKVADVEGALAMAVRATDPALYVATRIGRVVALADGKQRRVLDITKRVSTEGEGGTLGLAFDATGEHLYISYTDLHDDVQLDEYTFDGARADASSRRSVLKVAQLSQRHHGGNIVWGPDDLLWMGLGDGSNGKDPTDRAQSLGSLLGKLIRIDPHAAGSRAYSIPNDNPFRARKGARAEIFAFGLRNPWRFSFDRATGDLWIGDVGQFILEEVDFLRGHRPAGVNFGWNRLEGRRRFNGSPPKDAIGPIAQYNHNGGRCAVIGGYVYRGFAIPALQGAYLRSDFCEGTIHALVQRNRELAYEREVVTAKVDLVSSFGQGPDGELYVLSLSRGVLKLVAA